VSDENMYLYTYMVTITNNAVALIEMKFWEIHVHIFSPRGKKNPYHESGYKYCENIEIFVGLDTNKRLKLYVTHV
jgi:hypothetical protein